MNARQHRTAFRALVRDFPIGCNVRERRFYLHHPQVSGVVKSHSRFLGTVMVRTEAGAWVTSYSRSQIYRVRDAA